MSTTDVGFGLPERYEAGEAEQLADVVVHSAGIVMTDDGRVLPVMLATLIVKANETGAEAEAVDVLVHADRADSIAAAFVENAVLAREAVAAWKAQGN